MKKVALGIDIGGTNTKYGFVDKEGKVYCESSISTTTPGEKFEDYLNNLYNEVQKSLESAPEELEIIGVGVGAPNGNYFNGCIEFAANLPWKGIIRAAQLMGDKWGVPAYLTNDANAAAIGEMLFGTAKGMKDFIVITLGTGVGSGIVVNGEVVYGHDGFAGELGHVVVEPGDRECNCGRKGCLEVYCSANGIRRTVFELLCKKNDPSVLRNISFNELTSAKIYEAAIEGDHIAREAFRYTGKMLGRALADFVTFSSPEAIILFGGLAKSGELIRKPTEESMEEHMLFCFKNKVKVLLSSMDEGNVAVMGSAALAWHEMDKKNK